VTHEEGIAWLADTIIAERRQKGGEDGWLAAKFTDVATTWAASGWSASQMKKGLENLCVAVEARVAPFARGLPAPNADPMDRLATYICGVAAGDREALNTGFAMVRAAIDEHATVPKVDRDKIFGRFAFGVALRVVTPAGRA
jgi:hypothetical protein